MEKRLTKNYLSRQVPPGFSVKNAGTTFLKWRSFCLLLLVGLGATLLPYQLVGQNAIEASEQISPVVSYVPKSDKVTSVNYSFHQNRAVNPYSVSYEYDIIKYDDYYTISAKSFLSDLDLRFEEGLEMETIDDEVVFPVDLVVGQRLEDAVVNYRVSLAANMNLTYAIDLRNRIVTEITSITHEGKTYTAFVIESSLSLVKSLGDDKTVSSSVEYLKDWYVPGLGNIKRERNAQIKASNGEVSQHKSKTTF